MIIVFRRKKQENMFELSGTVIDVEEYDPNAWINERLGFSPAVSDGLSRVCLVVKSVYSQAGLDRPDRVALFGVDVKHRFARGFSRGDRILIGGRLNPAASYLGVPSECEDTGALRPLSAETHPTAAAGIQDRGVVSTDPVYDCAVVEKISATSPRKPGGLDVNRLELTGLLLDTHAVVPQSWFRSPASPGYGFKVEFTTPPRGRVDIAFFSYPPAWNQTDLDTFKQTRLPQPVRVVGCLDAGNDRLPALHPYLASAITTTPTTSQAAYRHQPESVVAANV